MMRASHRIWVAATRASSINCTSSLSNTHPWKQIITTQQPGLSLELGREEKNPVNYVMESCASSCTDSHCSTTIKREMKEDRLISLPLPLVEECDLFQGTVERDYRAELDAVQVTANEHRAPNRTSLDMLEMLHTWCKIRCSFLGQAGLAAVVVQESRR